MAQIKVHKSVNFTTISTHHIRNRELSLKAKGLLTLILSLPSDWDYSVIGLTSLSKDGKDAVMSALAELSDAGYICIESFRNDKGQYESVYNVFEEPNRDSRCGKSESGNPIQHNNNNIDIVSTKVETVRENNTPCLFEDNIGDTTPYNPPTTSEQEQMFDEFRRAYRGTKRGLRTEFENFRKKHKDWRDVLVHLLADYQRQVQVLDANKAAGAFVPQPKNLQTYINQRCWEEEISLTTQTGTPYGNTVIGREAARVQAGLGCIRAGLNAAHTERSTGRGTP